MLSRYSSLFRKFATATKKPVVVRIWEPTGSNVGHVSLQTSKNYISLWPSVAAGKPEIKWNTFKGERIMTPSKDEAANGTFTADGKLIPQAPSCVITLTQVDDSIIDDRFEKLLDGDLKWTLVGNNRLFLKEGIHSCASLVILLLREAGVDALFQKHGKDMASLMLDDMTVAVHKFIQSNIIVTPTNVKHVLEYALKLETEFGNKYNPLTKL